MKQEKGISLISLVITIVLMIIIAGTVISVSLGNLNTKNLTSMYTDLKSINDKIVIYYNKYGTLPIKEKFMGSYEFTTVANPNDDEEGYYIIDVNKLDKLILSKKISGNGNDVYIVNTQTHMVYYPEGVELEGEMYYRLPGEYSKLELITDLQMELKANTTDIVNAVTISVTGSSESGMKSYVSASGSTKTYTSVTKNIKESYEVKENGTYKFTLINNKGETVSKTITISNIDNQAPIVALTPNGGTGYVMPSEGNARIKTKIEVTDAGGSMLKTLQYAWSESKTTEPTIWTDFTNGQEIEKTDITQADTWYLWTKVIDCAGNRATNIKTSEGFVISANTEDEYVIELVPDYTDWTANDITVSAIYGTNLTPISLTCTGTNGTDYTLKGTTSVAVKTNNQTVTAKAQDKAGNVITATLTVTKIDKNAPIVTANAESVTITEGDVNNPKGYFTYSENGGAPIASVVCIDVNNNNVAIENTNTLSIGTHTIRCTVTKETGESDYAEITIVVEVISYGVLELYQDKKENEEGYDKNALHIGDFVTYTAGSFFETGDGTVKTEAFAFSGYTAGQSRDENATPISSDYDYVKDSNGKEITGWRIFDIKEDGSMVLITAGCPEDFYVANAANQGYISEYILTGVNPTNNDYSAYVSRIRNWEEYRNDKYLTTKATVLTKSILDNWYAKHMLNSSEADTWTNSTFQSIYGTKYETLIDNYAEVWLSQTNDSSDVGMYYIAPSYRTVKFYWARAGIRVLIYLSPETKIIGKTGTKILVDPRDSDNSWTYNVWEIKEAE